MPEVNVNKTELAIKFFSISLLNTNIRISLIKNRIKQRIDISLSSIGSISTMSERQLQYEFKYKLKRSIVRRDEDLNLIFKLKNK
jgi:hypothetical protein